jgi:putative ABC transport system permease protein
VTIGVASVILLTSLGEGARLYITGEFAALGTNLLVVLPGKTETTGAAPIFGGVPHDLTLEDVEALRRRVPQVREVAPLTIGEAQARFGDRSREVTVAGTTAEFAVVRKVKVATGRYLPDVDPDHMPRVCVIGPKIARELFQDTNPLGEFLRVGEERFRVIGVLAPRGVTIGMDLDEVVHIPAYRCMKMFNQTSLFRVLIEVRSHDEMASAERAVIRLLAERHDDTEDVTVVTQDSVLSSFGRILQILTAALAGIAAISLTVAGVGIMNVMLVSVSERTREIGLLKALGVTRFQVLVVFLVEASILSTAGGTLGLAVGVAAAWMFQVSYPGFPAQPPVWAVTASVILSVSVGMVFGALPARRASRLDPVESLSRS